MSLSDNYRPARFEKIVGQDEAVTTLSRLITGGRLRRNLLLQGAFGSGKTTLARIYAKALNCENVNEWGSPCNECSSCNSQQEYLFEYDVPGLGGDEPLIRQWVDERYRSPPSSKTRVLFFDEAHALKPAAMDVLLKRIEEPLPGIIFCCATTEPWKLKPALKSRMRELEVSALSVPDAVSLLERIADEEGIAYDRDALALLAAIKRGHPRDLINGLEQVADFDERVTVETIKIVFDLDPHESLVDYFVALGRGDRQRLTHVMRRWDASPGEKIRQVRAFLSSLYYQNILGQDLAIDALTSSITRGRAEIVSAFGERLQAEGPRALEPYWNAMMFHWSRFPIDRDQSALQLQLAVFEDFVSRQLPNSVTADGHSSVHLERRQASKADQPPFSLDDAFDHPGGADSRQRFLSQADVRDIVNRASFLPQHYGQLMNAAFTIIPSPDARLSEETAVAAVKGFCSELINRYDQGDILPSFIALLERDDGGVLGRVVAHIPKLTRSAEAGDELKAWCASVRARDGSQDQVIECFVADDGNGLRFHWKRVLQLCAGLGPDLSEGEQLEPHRLLRHLEIPRRFWRSPGPLSQPVLFFSPLLTDKAIAEASEYKMTPLSAFDAKAWHWVRTGWELKEFADRKSETARRARQIRDLKLTWAHDQQRLAEEMARASSEWPTEAEDRPRRWSTWRMESQ